MFSKGSSVCDSPENFLLGGLKLKNTNILNRQGLRYGFWAPWTAYSLAPSCGGFPLRKDHVPVESPSVEIAIAFSAEPCTRASNLDPGPRRSGPSTARVRQLNRITSPSPTRGCLFLSLLPNQIILFQLLKLFRFVCNGKVIIFRFIFL